MLYIGDTAKKLLFMDAEGLQQLGIRELSREMLPDVVAYEPERNWIFMVEAVYTSNPISRLRHMNLLKITSSCTAGPIFVSAFESMQMFGRYAKHISWETEVWVAENPEHMIHFDGDRFLGPYE